MTAVAAAGFLLRLLVHVLVGLTCSIRCVRAIDLDLDQFFDRYLELHVLYYLVLFCSSFGFDALPGEATH